jgi:hypothetical protein
MSVKQKFGSLSSVKKMVGRPKENFKVINKSSEEGTLEGETRATFIVNEELLNKLKAIAYQERKMIKEIVNEMLQDKIAKYEKNVLLKIYSEIKNK